MNPTPQSPKWNLTNILFLSITAAVALIGTPLYFTFHGFNLLSFILFLAFMGLTGFSITAGYHRLFSHKTYQTTWPVRLFWLCFGAAAFQNSALKWSADHRLHHQFVDTDRDPYSIKRGFWFAHIGWIFYNTPKDLSVVPDLQKDPLVRFQNRFIFTIGVIFGFLLPMGIAALWGDPWGGLLLAGFLRIVINHHFTFFINSLAHMKGRQPYDKTNSAHDNWIMAFLTYGEGYHNFHHAFPGDYRNGLRAYHWDPAKWLIFGLQKIGLAKNLRRAPAKTILLAQVENDQTELLGILAKTKKQILTEWLNTLQKSRDSFTDACERFDALKLEYQRLKKEKRADMRLRLNNLRADLKAARHNLKASWRDWRRTCRGYQLIFA